jgi:hypothetical protein
MKYERNCLNSVLLEGRVDASQSQLDENDKVIGGMFYITINGGQHENYR